MIHASPLGKCKVFGPYPFDPNANGIIDVGDVIFLVNFLLKGGPAPDPLAAGDANSDGVVDISDVVYLVDFLYRGGPPPAC